MTKAELIENIKSRLGSNPDTKHIHEKSVIGQVLDALAGVAGDVLFVDDEVPLPGLGKLVPVTRKARKGRNPKTGAPIDIPASRTVKFEPKKALKDALNGNS